MWNHHFTLMNIIITSVMFQSLSMVSSRLLSTALEWWGAATPMSLPPCVQKSFPCKISFVSSSWPELVHHHIHHPCLWDLSPIIIISSIQQVADSAPYLVKLTLMRTIGRLIGRSTSILHFGNVLSIFSPSSSWSSPSIDFYNRPHLVIHHGHHHHYLPHHCKASSFHHHYIHHPYSNYLYCSFLKHHHHHLTL